MSLFLNNKKFPIPLDTAVFTTVFVIKENSLITLVSHELDGAWQFMGPEPITDYTKIAMVVGLGEIIEHDKSILKLADLPKGHQATRQYKRDKWEIVKIEYSDDEIREMGFLCSICGELHKDVPMAYGADAPYAYFQIPKSDLENRCVLTQDACIIDNKDFYVKGQLNIPVDNNDEFSWSVWVLISKGDFEKMEEQWTDGNRILEKPYSGLLATRLDCYPETLNLPVQIFSQKVGMRPKIEIVDTSHPLFLEQENGINMDRVVSFARQILYGH